MRFRLNEMGRDYIKANLTTHEFEQTTAYNDLCREATEFANTTPDDCAVPNGYAYINAPRALLQLGTGCFDGPHQKWHESPDSRYERLHAEVSA